KSAGLPCTTAGSTPPRFGHEGFAVQCPLALLGVALYPVSVRRPAGSFPASFRRSLAVAPLRFPWVPVTKFPEDFHLPVSAHAGRTSVNGRRDERVVRSACQNAPRRLLHRPRHGDDREVRALRLGQHG